MSQKQLCELFDRDKSVISRHIRNIFKEGELTREATVAKNATVQKEGNRTVTREVEYYNLDLIISLGYRINSRRATKFRQWATKVLKEYLLKGYVLDKERLKKEKLRELERTIALIKQAVESRTLSDTEARGFIDIIGRYAKSWALLQGYDEQSLQEIIATREQRFILDYDEAKAAIAALKKELMAKGEASELFGREKAGEFRGNLMAIYQSFGGEELLPSVEQKAAIEMVMRQAEVLSDEWSAEAPEKSDYTMRMAMPAQKRDEELPLAAEPDQGIVGEKNVKETRD